MKIVDKNKEKKEKVKKKRVIEDKSNKEHVLIVAQEIKFARLLSGNEKKSRDRVLKALKKWLSNCFQKGYVFKEDDFTRIWKGLFYAVWMSDKPLIQEELCDTIAGILDLFPPEEIRHAVLLMKAGFKILATEWFGIDQHRIDKFLMLVRRYLRSSFRCLLHCRWSMESCQMFANMLTASDGIFALKTPNYARNATSMLLHIFDCYLEELAKVSKGDIAVDSLVELLRPVCEYTCKGEVPVLCAAGRRLLNTLLRQSEPGLRYQDATEAWKRMGCPAGGPEALELVSDDDEEEIQENGDVGSEDDENSMSTALDPRAGRVDVVLPLLPVPGAQLASLLRDMLANTTSKAHKRVKLCAQRFESVSKGEYPLALPYEPLEVSPAARGSLRKTARALGALEDKLRADADELKLRGLSRKHRKRLLKKTRAGLSIVDDVGNVKQSLSNSSTNENWQVETAELEAKKPKKDTSNKENVHKNKKNKKHIEQNKIRKRKIETAVQNGDSPNKIQKLVHKKNTDRMTETTDKKDTTTYKIKDINKKDATKVSITDTNTKNTKLLNCVGGNNDKIFLNTNKNTENVKENSKKQSNVENSRKEVTTNLFEKSNIESQKRSIAEKSEKMSRRKQVKKSAIENSKLQKKTNEEKPEKIAIRNQVETSKKFTKPNETKLNKNTKPSFIVSKVKKFQKNIPKDKKEAPKKVYESPKKVKFVLKNNSMQGPVDYYKSVRQSPNIPFDSSKQPSKTNLKPSTPSPINPFFKKKLKLMK